MRQNKDKNKQKYFFLFFERARQGLTLLLGISIRNRESGLRSSLNKIVCQVDIFICDIFVIIFLYLILK